MANSYIFALSIVFGFLVSHVVCTPATVGECPNEVHFAMKLLKQMYTDEKKNYVISPQSISNVMEILHVGLGGVEKSELVEFFGINDVEYTQLDASCEEELEEQELEQEVDRTVENVAGRDVDGLGDKMSSDVVDDSDDVIVAIQQYLTLGKSQIWGGLETNYAIRKLGENLRGSKRRLASLPATMQEVDVLFASRSNKMSPVYSELVSTEFGATASETEFGNNEAETEINELVAQSTNRMITNMLSNNVFDSQTELVVVSALFFKGTWDTSFNDAGQMDFDDGNSASLQVSMMSRTSKFHYSSFEGLKIVRVPYEGGTYAMYYIRHSDPYHRSRTLGTLIAKENLMCLINQVGPDHTTSSKIKLLIPKFEETLNVDLKAILQATGELNSFLNNPDFSRMLCENGNNVHISNIFHATKIEVSETGTVAAAATVASVRARMGFLSTVSYNVPHVYVLKNESTSEILFAGVYDSPV